MEILTPKNIVAADQKNLESRIGGKALGLAKLEKARSKVPSWLVIPTEYFLDHLVKGEFPQQFFALLARLESSPKKNHRKLVEKKAQLLRQTVEAVNLSNDLLEQLPDLLKNIGSGPFSVRSSMVGEDSATHSFAGQCDSFLLETTWTKWPRLLCNAGVQPIHPVL